MEHGTDVSRDRTSLHDHVALDEIELYAEVLIAVADADHRLTPAEIDRVLGVSSPARGAGGGVAAHGTNGADCPAGPQGGEGAGPPADPGRPPGPTEPAGPPARVPERVPATRPAGPREEEPGARVLPSTGPLFPETRVLPEAPSFTGMLPVPFDVPFAARNPPAFPLPVRPF